MNADEARAYLTQRQLRYEEREIPYGTSFCFESGEILNVYLSGKTTVQGRPTSLRDELLRLTTGAAIVAGPAAAAEPKGEARLAPALSGSVFVVSGHDEAARDGLELLLRRLAASGAALATIASSRQSATALGARGGPGRRNYGRVGALRRPC